MCITIIKYSEVIMKNLGFILILLGIALGTLGGIFFPEQMLSIRWVGILFMNMLKLIVLPLVFSALVSAIASMGDLRKLGAVGGYTLAYVMFSVSVAVLIGIVLVNIVRPGEGIDPSLILSNGPIEEHQSLEFSSFLLSLFPPNIIDAAAKFEIMPIVFFSIVFALGCTACGESAKPVVEFITGLRNVFVKMITWLMHLTPIGLFALLGTAVAEAVKQNRLMESVKGMALFLIMFLCGLFLHVLWQWAVVKFVAKRNGRDYMSAASGALVTAFGTSSSMATLPVTLAVAKEQQISEPVAKFVLPFATTINLAGTAMYEAVSALFFAQILGLHFSIWQQCGIFVAAIVAGMGATGIPEGGLVTMITVLRSVNIPTSAIALLLPFDRILDRFRTVVNVWGDLVCAATVDVFIKRKQEAQAKRAADEKTKKKIKVTSEDNNFIITGSRHLKAMPCKEYEAPK